MASVLVPLAQGCEELEAITITDLLVRAGIDVTTAGLDDEPVTASRGTVIVPDTNLQQALEKEYDMLVLPGGLPGADNLNQDERIHSLVKKMAAQGKYTAAICAAPKVFARAGLLAGKKATSYPGVLEAENLVDTELTGSAVQIDGTVVTSRGPGTAMDFTLQLIGLLVGDEKRQEVEKALVR